MVTEALHREGTLNHSPLGSIVRQQPHLHMHPDKALERSETSDKIIVDRRKKHRNTEVMRAVRQTRDRLSNTRGNPVFDRELLKLHARSIMSVGVAMPLLVVLVATGGMLVGLGGEMLIWALVAATSYAALAYYALKVDRADPTSIEAERAKIGFLIGHLATGVGWAYFAVLRCVECSVEQFPVIQAVVLLMAIGATAILASALRGALVATFALPVAFYVLFSARYYIPVEAMMAGVLLVSLPFFVYVASFLNRSTVMLLSLRTEKDWLIAELATAKSMSDEARRRAEEANLAKSRFLASMSHELRTPLNAILGFSEVMSNEVLGPVGNESYREYIRDIHSSGRHLLELINEILDLSRIEAGRYQINEEQVSLEAIADECCHMMEMKARGKEITIHRRFEPEMPRLVADERSVRQIVLNLLSNAVKFTPTGGEIEISVGWTAGGGQYVKVKDNGPGIAEEEIPVVLAAFGQGSIAIKSAEQGTGLGLPIVQALLQMHGGSFDLKSKLRAGTEAIAIFPRERVMEALPAVPTTGGRKRGKAAES